jgi:hypothetical protein
MEPVRVKIYGLVSVTKFTYLVVQAIGAVVLALLYLVSYALPVSIQYQSYWRWFIVIIVVLEMIETSVILWKFAQAERAQRAASVPFARRES